MNPEGEDTVNRLSRLSQRITAQVARGAGFVRTTPSGRLNWEELNGLSAEEEENLFYQLENQGFSVTKKSGGVYYFSPKRKGKR